MKLYVISLEPGPNNFSSQASGMAAVMAESREDAIQAVLDSPKTAAGEWRLWRANAPEVEEFVEGEVSIVDFYP